jgi:HAD superfamily hydrolase (TIGR01490 family)
VQAAFFDLDKTVIAKASMVAFGRPFQRAGMISRWLVLRALYGQLVYLYLGADEARMTRMRESALRITQGWDQRHVRELVRETLEEVIEPIIFEEALDLIREHQAAGRRVYIISASPEEIVEPLTEYLGADQAIATRTLIDDQGRYTGEVEFYSYGPEKATAMLAEAEARGIDLAESYAYSDSATDIPMLEVVGHPVAVNPDRALERHARERGWEIRDFLHKVPLRQRVPVPPAGPTAAVSGTLAMAAAGAVTWWWLRRRGPATRRARAAATARDAATAVARRWPTTPSRAPSSRRTRRGRPGWR